MIRSGFRVACLLGFIALVANPGRANVVITEIMYNPAGLDGQTPPAPVGEWVSCPGVLCGRERRQVTSATGPPWVTSRCPHRT